MPFYELKQALAQKLEAAIGQPEFTAEKILGELGNPPSLDMGHVALPCFQMAKAFKKAPTQIAADLIEKVSGEGISGKVAGPYANFRWETATLFEKTLSAISNEGESYGSDTSGQGQKVILEYCSPNIAKRLAFHHIRSTLLGNTLANIYQALGYEAIRMNFVGDWGAQFARLLAAFDLWGEDSRLSLDQLSDSMDHLAEIYVRFHKEVDAHPEHTERAAEWLKRLEKGDETARALWKKIRDISLAAMNQTLARLNVHFDIVEGESHYIDRMDETLADVKTRAKAELSEGAYIVQLDGIDTPALVQKTDGTTLYLTRDIAAAADRFKRFQFSKMHYVVANQQSLHFKQLFGVLSKMGESWADRCNHISFGTVLFGSEKMSTRDGNVILLDAVLQDAKRLALEECTKKNPDLANKDEVAEKVGIGAIIFGELSSHKHRDINFDWKTILALDGETGPYVQYAVVRTQSLMKKAEGKGLQIEKEISVPEGYAFGADEEALILSLSKLRSVLHQSVRDDEPFYLTRYLIDLAKQFSRFYNRLPVLQATDPNQQRVRLQLVAATRTVLVNGLSLLGIEAPSEM